MAKKMKVKILEIYATKLDPNSHYLIALNNHSFTLENASDITLHLQQEFGIKVTAVVTNGPPKENIEVYQIPTSV